MKNLKLFLTLFVGVLVIVALFGSILLGREVPASNCIDPHLDKIPSPMPQKNPRAMTWSGNPLAVPEWWKPQLNADQQTQYDNITLDPNLQFFSASAILAYKNQIWIAHNTGIVRFDATHNNLVTYQIPTDSAKEIYDVEGLYLMKNHTLWAVLHSSTGFALAQYDLTIDKFRTVHDKNGLLNQQRQSANEESPSVIGELSNGNLVFVAGWEIFSFDPASQQAKKLLGLDTGLYVRTIAISNDDIVWFTNGRDFVIRSLNPATGKISEYGEPASLVRDDVNQAGLAEKSSKAIAVDDQGRVWVGYFDRLEPDGNGNYAWQEVKRPTVFVDDTHIYDTYDRAVYIYKWSPVISVAKFSDGTMWFSTEVGVVEYDIAKDNWCWSATQPFRGKAFSLITEDEQGNVWMVSVAVNQIYKLER
jgi:streptogramin lyase